MDSDETQVPIPEDAEADGYNPAVMTEFGTVTGATLGTNKKKGIDETEYWH
ncbi:hypothetical protein ACL02R_29340 [Streptomyces sp. MS19]|uniref:hypothetical protein n=1 Tax=Streptomyces sp. MS19 TaxID=3385972 RepID=UPI0039A07DE9